MKEFKSNEELIDYLKSKGVTIRNKKEALKKIERYTYYSVINTYKEVFKNGMAYKPNVTFNEIFALYEFDKNLRFIFLKYSLEIENTIKSIMANEIARKYGIKDYLDISNFDSKADVQKINELISRMQKEVNDNYGKHNAITHYLDKYGYIPPFVLVKIISFGQMSRYYGLLKQIDRQNISKYFNIKHKLLKQILINLTLIRNHSAHSNRLFTFHSKFLISFKQLDPNYNTKDKSTNLYMMITCMKKLLDEKEAKKFDKEIKREIKKLKRKLHSISIIDILNIMGFPNE